MYVPEAAVNKDNLPHPCEHKVGFPWKVFYVQSIAESQSADDAPHQHLRLRVFAADRRHAGAALLGSEDVHSVQFAPYRINEFLHI